MTGCAHRLASPQYDARGYEYNCTGFRPHVLVKRCPKTCPHRKPIRESQGRLGL